MGGFEEDHIFFKADQKILQYLAHVLLLFQMFLLLVVVNKCELFTAVESQLTGPESISFSMQGSTKFC